MVHARRVVFSSIVAGLLAAVVACGPNSASGDVGTTSASAAPSTSPTAAPHPTYDNGSVAIPNVPQSVVDRIPANLNPQPESEATVPEATAQATADGIANTSWYGHTFQLEGFILASAVPPSESQGPLDWIFVYYSTSEVEPPGCPNSAPSGADCGGHYFFVAIDAASGQTNSRLIVLATGT